MSEPTTAYFHGDFRPLADAKISVRSKALNYGLGCFEGIRGYWNQQASQLFIFRLEDHYRRLQQSCRILHLPLNHNVEEMVQITVELCRRNNHREDIYIRPIAFCNSERLPPILIEEDGEFAIYTMPMGDYLDTSKGVTACVSSWRRVSDNMIPARAKPTAAYLNSALARYEAKANGYDEAILLTNEGYVSEASAEHIFIVRNGTLITSSAQDDILEGITRHTILEVAPSELNRQVIERRISRTELYAADEAFLCGTGAQIAPLVMIDQRKIADGAVGPVTEELQKLYFAIVRGEVTKYAGWCQPVYA